MKRYFGIIVALIFVVVAIVWGSGRWSEKNTEMQRDANAARIKAEYLERAAWLRSVPEQKAYIDEAGTFYRWYFKEVNEHLNKFGGNRNFDDYLIELSARAAKKGASDKYSDLEAPSRGNGDQTEQKKAMFEYTKKAFDAFKSGTYSPMWTGTDKGIRLDIVSASSQNLGGEAKIHMPVVLTGWPREERVDDKGVKRVTCNAKFAWTWKLFDEKQKLIGEMPGEGGPENRVDWAERYIKFFPPMVLIGHFDVDKLPPEVKTVEIAINVTGRSPTGGDMLASYSWKLDAPAEWKLGVGETWKGAQESIRPEEEIDPAAAAKKNGKK